MTLTPFSSIKLGEVTLDLEQGRLTGPTGEVTLRAKSFALLAVLARNRGRVMDKDALMAAVWPTTTVSDESLTQCIHDIRTALGPKGAALLRTVPRRGYLLDATADAAPVGPIPGSIAVMPFVLTGQDAARDQVLFEGLAHDVISRLARLRAFHVIGRGTSFSMRHMANDPVAFGQLAQVAYLVTGRAIRRGARFDLHVDLLNCITGHIVWSDTFSMATDAVMQAASALPDPIVSAIAREVTAQERRIALRAPEDLPPDAWRSFHMGLNLIFGFDKVQMQLALTHFETAIALDPGFARAHAFASFCHYFFAFSGMSSNRSDALHATLATASQAMTLDPESPVALWAMGRALWLNGNAESGLQHISQAVALCPSFPHAHYMAGFIEAHQGDAARALEHLNTSESLSPFDPFLASIQITKAVALTRQGEMDAAAICASRAAQQSNAYAQLRCNAALILAATGHVTEARGIMAQIRLSEPTYRPQSLFTAIPSMTQEMRSLLQQEFAALQRDFE
ncbi:MAG: winged helix-turn-helix domain-containing tetratricopeptide repeat protein [Paracoccaceae bacterium]